MATFFYDSQVKRFLIQFARIFSNWYVTYGSDDQGNPILHRVPIMYGDASRQAGTIIANNSASNLPSAPLMTYYITGIEYDQRRTQDPYFIDKMYVRQRTYNTETREFEITQGNAFNVERIMPVPYTLRMQVDAWTTNYNQKLELFEQLGVLFNPSMELQSTDNFIDWTSLSTVYQDGLTFSSRTVPQGTGNPIDIMSWKFYMPIWISSPIKVQKFNVIHKIIASIHRGKAIDDIQDEDLLLGTRQKITPYGYKVLLIGGALQVLPNNTAFNPSNSDVDLPEFQQTCLFWKSVLNPYGTVRPGISMIALEHPSLVNEILGTIRYNETDDRILEFDIDVDTLPANTLDPVLSVINPNSKIPGDGLPAAAAGQRYLIVEEIAPQLNYPIPSTKTSAWIGLATGASANSIIEFDGTEWFVSFDATADLEAQEFVTNLTSNIQYRFDRGTWVKSYEGWYEAGDWRIII
jgi:hypothetical protein